MVLYFIISIGVEYIFIFYFFDTKTSSYISIIFFIIGILASLYKKGIQIMISIKNKSSMSNIG